MLSLDHENFHEQLFYHALYVCVDNFMVFLLFFMYVLSDSWLIDAWGCKNDEIHGMRFLGMLGSDYT